MSKRNQKSATRAEMENEGKHGKVRLDKWLWAARFYKTRSISRDAIDGGKVHVNGQRVKPSRDAQLDDIITLRHGIDEKTVVIKALSSNRLSAPDAQKLYEETQESLQKREEEAAKRKALRGSNPLFEGRPDKKQRRDIHKLRQMDFD